MGSKIAVRDKKRIKQLKSVLEDNHALDKGAKISTIDGVSYIYSTASPAEVLVILAGCAGELDIQFHEEKSAGKSLESVVRRYLDEASQGGIALDVDLLMTKVPKKWSIFNPMILFNAGGFDSEEWTDVFDNVIPPASFFSAVRSVFPATITHFAINKPIVESDVMRRPFNLVPLHGDFGPQPSDNLFDLPSPDDLEDAFWCHAVQNGIYQTWAPRFTMFSRGNITEKKRILDTYTGLKGQFVLDFYAGIGYFTLSYLANGATLLCWELNPWSIEGLVRGLAENGYKYKVIRASEKLTKREFNELMADGVRAFVFHESNEHVTSRLEEIGQLPISHINLGLLPTLYGSWSTVKSVRNKWTLRDITVHVHENEHKDHFTELEQKIAHFYQPHANVLRLVKVKTFAPDIWHVVVDVEIGGAAAE